MLSRVLQGIAALLLIAIVSFFLVRAAPGDTASVIAGESGMTDQNYVGEVRRRLDLDLPVLKQLEIYLRNLVHLDLGRSARQQAPVVDLILERLPATLLLTGVSYVLSLVVGIAVGAAAARRVGTWTDSALTTLVLIFYATPMYWLALMLVLLFSVNLGWLPGYGYESVGASLTGAAAVLDVARHLVLPAICTSLFYMTIYARMTRASMLEVARMDFVKTAHAKGVHPSRVQRAHILRNALLPVVTIAGIQAGAMMGGAILTETVFAWPGVGRLMYDALVQRDYNLLLGCFMVTAAMAVLFNVLTDLIYTIIDPRIEL